MNLICPALGEDLDLGAGIASEFSIKVIGNQLKLLNTVDSERASSRPRL